jgi:hypothetical protein
MFRGQAMQNITLLAGDFWGKGCYAGGTFTLTRHLVHTYGLCEVAEVERVVERYPHTTFTQIFKDGRSFLGEMESRFFDDLQHRVWAQAALDAPRAPSQSGLFAKLCSADLWRQLFQ